MGASYRQPEASARRAWVTLALVSAGLFLAVMSKPVVSVALPDIGTGLLVAPAGLEWLVETAITAASERGA